MILAFNRYAIAGFSRLSMVWRSGKARLSSPTPLLAPLIPPCEEGNEGGSGGIEGGALQRVCGDSACIETLVPVLRLQTHPQSSPCVQLCCIWLRQTSLRLSFRFRLQQGRERGSASSWAIFLPLWIAPKRTGAIKSGGKTFPDGALSACRPLPRLRGRAPRQGREKVSFYAARSTLAGCNFPRNPDHTPCPPLYVGEFDLRESDRYPQALSARQVRGRARIGSLIFWRRVA
jgi:hypothetical protein